MKDGEFASSRNKLGELFLAVFSGLFLMPFPVSGVGDTASDGAFLESILGATNGEVIETGFVFVDGEYIDLPYTVSRRGRALFINDRLIDAPYRWPTHLFPSGDTDPVLPASINAQSSFFDDQLRDYILAKVAYVQRHYDLDEERLIMEAVYRNLPCVREASLAKADPSILNVTLYNGEQHPIGLLIPRRRANADKDDFIWSLEFVRKGYEEGLRQGRCYLFFSDGSGHVTLSNKIAIEILKKVVPILRSQDSLEKKFDAVQGLGMKYVAPDSFSKFVTNFSASAQLDQRLLKE